MSNFIYISDTHIGSIGGYHQQNPYFTKIEKIIEALNKYLQKNEDIKFILHGGDIIDETSENNIKIALKLFKQLPIPTYLCLGNHDLTKKDASKTWFTLAPNFFKEKKCNYTIIENDYVIHVIPCNWCNIPMFWDRKCQDPNFTHIQVEQIKNEIMKYNKKIQIILYQEEKLLPGKIYH